MRESTRRLQGSKVYGGKRGTHDRGKVSRAVLHPHEARVVGFLIRRPDALLMIRRHDAFVALDSLERVDDRLVATDRAGWGPAALERLGILLDRCFIWEDLPLLTEDGFELGRVGDLVFDGETGEVISIVPTDGRIATLIDGVVEIPVEHVQGFRDGFLVVDPEASGLVASGGLAAAAGRGFARASQKASAAKEKAGQAVDRGAYALGGIIGGASGRLRQAAGPQGDPGQPAPGSGEPPAPGEEEAPASRAPAGERAAEAVGRQLGRTRGMFKSFRQEFERASRDDDDGQVSGGR